eukprot:403368754
MQSNSKHSVGSYNNNSYSQQPPKIEYDASELESKTPEELDRILKQMEDYSKQTYQIYGGQAPTQKSSNPTPKYQSSSRTNIGFSEDVKKPPRNSSRPPIPTNNTQMRLTQQEENKHKNFGKVPKYLQNFRTEKDEIQREIERELEKKNCPPGTRLMDEDERIRMLRDLEANKNELINQIERMPISMKTLSLQKRRDELEEQIKGIDRNISTFSKKKVFVAL